MIEPRTVLLVGVVGAVVLLPAGIAGSPSVAADRGLEVGVAPDSDAYLGIERTCGADGALGVRLTNRFARTTLDVTVHVNGTAKTARGLEPGTTAVLTFSANTSSSGDQIAVEGTGTRATVQLERLVPDGC